MIVFMVVTADKYELPLAVGETYGECAEIFGVDAASLCRAFKAGTVVRKQKDGTLYKVIKVDIGGPKHKLNRNRKKKGNQDGINN